MLLVQDGVDQEESKEEVVDNSLTTQLARKIKNYARYKILSKGELNAQEVLAKIKKKRMMKNVVKSFKDQENS